MTGATEIKVTEMLGVSRGTVLKVMIMSEKERKPHRNRTLEESQSCLKESVKLENNGNKNYNRA